MSDRERQRLFWVWCDMRQRCCNPKHKAYPNYGGRGIKVCERWESFENFLADMGPRIPEMLLERINNAGDYQPDNCKWVTRKEQNSNRRNCIYVFDNDELITLKEFCRRYNLTYRAIHKRIQERGWPMKEALHIPLGSGRRRKHG